MIILGIETATPVCSVGLAGENGMIAESSLIRKNSHAEVLPEMVDHICRTAQVGLRNIQGIAVSGGPGSFTGLRIGLGYAKGLAFGTGLPLSIVPTLDGLVSQTGPSAAWACVLLTARKGEAYRGLFRWQDKAWFKVQPDDEVTADGLFEALPDEPVLFLGDGIRQFQEILADTANAVVIPSGQLAPRGIAIARLGREQLTAGINADIDTSVPVYIKRFQGIR